ncbi:MAG: hypothetical protein U0X39_05755 [Bacteroidales bacterium]
MPIRNHCVSTKDWNIAFINFKQKEDIGDHCNGNCSCKFDFFIVEQNGRCLLQSRNLSQVNKYLKSNKLLIHKDISKIWNYPAAKYKYLVAKFRNIDQRVKNCFICRYHAINENLEEERSPIFCKFLKVTGNSNLAVDCKYFRAEKKYIDEYVEEGEAIIKHLNQRIPDNVGNLDEENFE